jgi:hypothetical protein
VALTVLTSWSRLWLERRRAPLPPLGEKVHLTAVVRLGASVVPRIDVATRHYVYPPETVHVTVSNLDRSGADLDVAMRRLSELSLPAPTLRVGELGCSPDTLFLRCVHDRRLDRLREAVEQAFEVRTGRSPRSWLFRRLSFANVVRFDGPGEWAPTLAVHRQVRCLTLEIVRTDRYLSIPGTAIIETIALKTTD